MSRTVPEWVGATDDTRAPPRVRARIFDRDNRCHLCHQPIQVGQKWDLDHVKALVNGGENREANLRPSHRKCHVEKTARDVAEKAKTAAVHQKHIGASAPKQTIKSAGFPKAARPEKTSSKIMPGYRQLFAPSDQQKGQ
jgi:5-methylcytosine-specific restriction endonuclease McrA